MDIRLLELGCWLVITLLSCVLFASSIAEAVATWGRIDKLITLVLLVPVVATITGMSLHILGMTR